MNWGWNGRNADGSNGGWFAPARSSSALTPPRPAAAGNYFAFNRYRDFEFKRQAREETRREERRKIYIYIYIYMYRERERERERERGIFSARACSCRGAFPSSLFGERKVATGGGGGSNGGWRRTICRSNLSAARNHATGFPLRAARVGCDSRRWKRLIILRDGPERHSGGNCLIVDAEVPTSSVMERSSYRSREIPQRRIVTSVVTWEPRPIDTRCMETTCQ